MREAFLCFLRVNIIQEDNCLFKYSKIPHIQPFLLNSPPNFEVDQFPNADKAIKSKSRSTPPGTANLQMQTDVTCSKINIAFLTPFLRCICPDD